MNTKTRSALRSALQQESEALAERLPEPAPAAAETTAEPQPAAPVDTPVEAPAAVPVVEMVEPVDAAQTAVDATLVVEVPAAEKSKPATKAPKPAAKAPKAVKAEKADKHEKADKPAKAVKPEKAEKLAKAVREKVVRDSFSMPKTEHAQLKTLRETLAKAGRICTKSELLRAGIQLLLKESPASVKGLVEGLAVVPKGKGAK